jgi:YgjP-like, metallopeptidase domain/AAA ATPase domain
MSTVPNSEALMASDERTKPAFLRRVRIRGYKSIAFCDVTLEPLTILVGRNASGKSNFVAALAFLRDVVVKGVHEAVKLHGGRDAVLCQTIDSSFVSLEVEARFQQQGEQRFFENYLPTLPPRRYVSGESHRYLGRQYRLRVLQADADGVKMARGQINVGLVDLTKKERVRSLVTRWFRQRAEAVFGEVFKDCSVRAERHGIQATGFQIRKMTNRWGSCTAEGHILLNIDLIVARSPASSTSWSTNCAT